MPTSTSRRVYAEPFQRRCYFENHLQKPGRWAKMGWLQAIFYSTSKNQEGDSPNFDEIVLIYQPIFGREINLPNRSQMMTTRVLSEDEISRFQSDGVAYVEQAVEGK